MKCFYVSGAMAFQMSFFSPLFHSSLETYVFRNFIPNFSHFFSKYVSVILFYSWDYPAIFFLTMSHNTTPVIFPKEMKLYVHIQTVLESLLRLYSQSLKPRNSKALPQMIDKQCHRYTYNGILFSKKE